MPRLVDVYVAAFSETIEYCDYSKKQIRASARRALDDHFLRGRRGQPLPSVSQAAFDNASGQELLLGAALIVRTENGPLLDLLFVSPDCQRSGIATAMVSAAVNELHKLGEQRLASQYHIGNDQSRAWHQGFGFVEEPDITRARLYRMCARHELWRREQLGDLPGEERTRLNAECEFWEAQVEQLKRIEDEQGFDAVHPMARW
jgi:GNAT superfamily N-acetyltransferase